MGDTQGAGPVNEAVIHQLVTGESPAEEPAAIDVRDLGFTYKDHRALRGVTFKVLPRTIHGFVGPNGAGKTTALKVLATLLRHQTGRVRILGLDLVKDYKEVREKIGFMPDHFSMYRQMTVFEYLDFFAAAYGMRLAQRDRVIADILKLTDMEGRRDDLIRSLSRGMQQRVSLARVLVHDPQVLLLDEPASGLDPRARIELMEILRELRSMGKTIFISSHILSELALLCDSFTIIDRGQVRYTGPKQNLLVQDGERRRFLFVLAAPHPPTEEALAKLAGVAEVARQEMHGAYSITFAADRVAPNDILRAILDSGGQVVSLQEDSGQLNQAFMELTEPGVTP